MREAVGSLAGTGESEAVAEEALVADAEVAAEAVTETVCRRRAPLGTLVGAPASTLLTKVAIGPAVTGVVMSVRVMSTSPLAPPSPSLPPSLTSEADPAEPLVGVAVRAGDGASVGSVNTSLTKEAIGPVVTGVVTSVLDADGESDWARTDPARRSASSGASIVYKLKERGGERRVAL